jgi:SAM-dependent methyltransferase
MYHAVAQYPHVRVRIFGDRLPATHAPREHRVDRARELLDGGIGWTAANVHVNSLAKFTLSSRRARDRLAQDIREGRRGPLAFALRQPTEFMKEYDREYYHRWYRDPLTRVATAETVRRKVRLALSAAEFMLGRTVESVLDIGCGEGRWYPTLRRIRPDVVYQGIDPSRYVVDRFGKRRNMRLGTFGELARFKFRQPFDLIVCSDVIQYVADKDLRRGLAEVRRLTGGIAYLETFTIEDCMEGDRDGWIDRSEKTMRRFFRDAGLTHCGFYCWLDERKITNANRFEIPWLVG